MKNLRRAICILLAGTLFVSGFAGCNSAKKDEGKTLHEIPVRKIMAYIEDKYPDDVENAVTLLSDFKGGDSNNDFYSFSEEMMKDVTDFIAVRSLGKSAREHFIIQTSNSDEVKEELEAYKNARQTDFTGYAPKEAKNIEDSSVVVAGNYVALFIDEKSEDISSTFEEALENDFEMSAGAKDNLAYYDQCEMDTPDPDDSSEKSSEVPSGKTSEPTQNDTKNKTETKKAPDGTTLIKEVFGQIEVYDTSNIVKAYKADNRSLLTDKHDIAVYDKLKEIIPKIIKPGMTEYEKEVAAHNYIVKNTDYDEYCLTYSDWYSEYSDQPYGCLIDKRAICVGYATTFKLFMDILDIECLVVTGSANDEPRGNHGWNLVHLDDGKWYAVDVTWDDPVGCGDDIFFTYFNVDDQCLSESFHYWDKDKYPKATSGKYYGLEEDQIE